MIDGWIDCLIEVFKMCFYFQLRSYVKHPEMEIGRRGAKSKFTKAEEMEIEKMLLDFATMGVPLGRPLLAKIVAVFATAKGQSQ